nr:HAD-IIIC family phosphatase [Legionella sp. km772]
MGLNQWFDKQLWYSARYALSYEAIPYLAQSLAALIGSLLGIAKKALVLDLDNTCWGNQIGEEGIEGIALGSDSAEAEVYTEFQHYLKLLKERGIILAVCSKNNVEQAKAGFKHPDTVLTEDDFATFTANWEPKDKNLAQIANSLNLHLDSLVFIDDNPAERQLIADSHPEVRVPNIGSNAINFIEHIDRNYYFETAGLSIEDLNRHDFYQRRLAKSQDEKHYPDYGAYLDSLSMTAEIHPFSAPYWPRITQLINKTHQFNLTNKLFTLTEIERISTNPNYLNLYGRLADLYGDHGLIAALIARIENKECHIDSWLMSCRVFNRTMEQAMLDTLVKQCHSLGVIRLIGYYYPTPKNSVVADLYQDFGFTLKQNLITYSVWELDLNDYRSQSHHIRINQ